MRREGRWTHLATGFRLGRDRVKQWAHGLIKELRRTGTKMGTGLGEQVRRWFLRLGVGWQVAVVRLGEAWVGLAPAQRAKTLAGTTAAVAFCLLALTGGYGLPAAKPLGGGPRFITYFENSGDAQAPGSFPGLRAHHAVIDTIMPLWFNVNAAGNVVNSRVDAAVSDYARTHKIHVEPMFVNLGYRMLTTSSARQRTAANISQTVISMGFAGADVDFELLPPTVRTDYNLFIKLLATKMHGAGKVLSVTVFPKPGVSYGVAGADDYRSLAQSANYLVLMAYDNHSDSSGPGPVAPIPWVRAGLLYALKKVPPSKLVLAVGQYGYNWDTSTGVTHYVSTLGAKLLAKSRAIPVQWNSGVGEAHYQYGGHIVWFQNTRSLALELGLVRQYHLRGYALWRLGFETPGFWNQVAKNLK